MKSRRRIQTKWPRLLPIIYAALLLHRSTATVTALIGKSSSYSDYNPIRYKVNQKQTECLYDKFQQGEIVTFSVFVVEALNNGKPKCSVLYEGPLMEDTDSNNTKNENNNPKLMSLGRRIRQGLLNDWKHIKKDVEKSIDLHVKVDWTHAGEEEDKLLLRQEMERENIQQMKKHAGNAAHPKPPPVIAPSRIEPYEVTHTIPTSGYYRLCAKAELQALVVEMDMRSSSKMGGVDQETGHVYTYAKRNLLDEEAAIDTNGNSNRSSNGKGRVLDSNTYQSEIEELSKILVNQVETSDLRQTREQIKVLNAKTSDIMTEIHNRMTRIKAHEHSARRNSANLAFSSKMETLLFAVISGFQVYTMRKWLLSNSVLGR